MQATSPPFSPVRRKVHQVVYDNENIGVCFLSFTYHACWLLYAHHMCEVPDAIVLCASTPTRSYRTNQVRDKAPLTSSMKPSKQKKKNNDSECKKAGYGNKQLSTMEGVKFHVVYLPMWGTLW
jgi:hypothetical protein